MFPGAVLCFRELLRILRGAVLREAVLGKAVLRGAVSHFAGSRLAFGGSYFSVGGDPFRVLRGAVSQFFLEKIEEK